MLRATISTVCDGEPLLAPIAGTSLSFAVNTNWDVFFDAATKTWYLLNNGAWLMAPVATGPWIPAGRLPAAFSALPADASFAAVKQQIPGRAIAPRDAPVIFVSTTPAAIIVTTGPPRYVAIAGTPLSYVANSDAAVFRDASSGTIYFLVSGRWFKNGGQLIRRVSYFDRQLAESHLTSRLFRQILRHIDRLAWHST